MNHAPPIVMRKCIAQQSRRAGFTLVEMMVAAGLVGIVLSAGATLTYQVTRSREQLNRLSEHHAQADAAIRTLTGTLRNQFRNVGGDAVLFVGTDEQGPRGASDVLRFHTVTDRVVREGHAGSDVHEVEFYLVPQPDRPWSVLTRRSDPTRNAPPDEGGVVEPIADRVLAFDVLYFDGSVWSVDWPMDLAAWPTAARVLVVLAVDDEGQVTRTYERLIHWPMMPSQDQDQRGSGS